MLERDVSNKAFYERLLYSCDLKTWSHRQLGILEEDTESYRWIRDDEKSATCTRASACLKTEVVKFAVVLCTEPIGEVLKLVYRNAVKGMIHADKAIAHGTAP
ncbi:MAG: hypothetical protein AD742_12205 [Methylibium sp. NZG]|nr:MAG: hypothetical protein AD742_12205 [Methylibium sp. NZG]